MPLLIVTDNAEAFRTVATISLVSEPDGMTFRINQTAARARGLALSSQLLKLRAGSALSAITKVRNQMNATALLATVATAPAPLATSITLAHRHQQIK